MSEAKHTPGPWNYHAEEGYICCGLGDRLYTVGKPVKLISGTSQNTLDANGTLMAAAPDMLEALENVENDAEQMPHTAWVLIRNAIAKAKGETP